MRKLVTMLAIMGLLAVGIFYLMRSWQYRKVVKANVELVCYEEVNRLTYEYMMEDGIPKNEIRERLGQVAKKYDEIAQKYGWKSGEDLGQFVSNNFSPNKIQKMGKEAEKKIRETCSPNYEYNGL